MSIRKLFTLAAYHATSTPKKELNTLDPKGLNSVFIKDGVAVLSDGRFAVMVEDPSLAGIAVKVDIRHAKELLKLSKAGPLVPAIQALGTQLDALTERNYTAIKKVIASGRDLSMKHPKRQAVPVKDNLSRLIRIASAIELDRIRLRTSLDGRSVWVYDSTDYLANQAELDILADIKILMDVSVDYLVMMSIVMPLDGRECAEMYLHGQERPIYFDDRPRGVQAVLMAIKVAEEEIKK